MNVQNPKTEDVPADRDTTGPADRDHPERNELFRLAWEMASDAMVLSDPEGIVLAANPAYRRLYGYSAEQIVGQSFAIIFPETVREWAVEQYKLYFAGHESPPAVESSVQRADGARRIVETSVAFITEGGQRTAMLSIIRDITDRMETAALLRAKEELEAEIAARRELQGQLERMREEERTRLAREIHDELGGALTGLKMDLAYLRRKVPADQPAWEARLTGMMSLVDETVVTMRRIASDLRPAVLDDLGVANALELHVEEFRRRSGIDCRLVVEPESLELDPQRSVTVYRVVQEALTNVLRHAAATNVDVRLQQHDHMLELAVKDDGQGMPPERHTNPATLGLAGMQERVELLGGRLEIESALGQGTTVRVAIPTQP